MLYICNSFSLSMLPQWALTPGSDDPEEPNAPPTGATVTVEPVEDPAALVAAFEADGETIVSAVGHADTARVFTGLLGRDVQVERRSINLYDDDAALVGQYIGPRLPEGATTLPEGARIAWALVRVQCP